MTIVMLIERRFGHSLYIICFCLLYCVLATPPPPAFSLRLTDGFYDSSGRVEIFDGNSWGIICMVDNQHQWNLRAASVACRQLGYPIALTATGIRGVSVAFVISRDVSCKGTESKLTDCTFELSQTYGCDDGRFQAAVVCKPNEGNNQLPYFLQLAGGRNSTQGNIQLQPFDEHWSICNDEFWDVKAATVLCRELGFEHATETTGNNYFGTDSTWTVVGSVQCSGTEKYLLECSHVIIDKNSCRDPVAGVKCSTLPSPPPGKVVRLVGSPRAYEGQVQTYYNGNWWNICTGESSWLNDQLADAVCESLGYWRGEILPTLRYTSKYSEISTEDSLLSQVVCNSNEDDLSLCDFEVSYLTKCGYYDRAAVHCDVEDYDFNVNGGVPFRLTGGDGMVSGRLEIYWNWKWHTMCGWSGWDIHAATVVCHQLGFDGAIATGTLPLRGEATKDIGIMYYQSKCTGKEETLDACEFSELSPDCTHEQDVSVTCSSLPYDLEGPSGDEENEENGIPTFAIVAIVVVGGVVFVSCIIISCKQARRSHERDGGNRQGNYELADEGTGRVTAGSHAVPRPQTSATAPSADSADMESPHISQGIDEPKPGTPPPSYDQV